MPTIASVRTAIMGKLNAVAGIGATHDYERYAASMAGMKALYLSGGQIKGWNLRRVATEETSPAVGRYVVTHRWRIAGYMALDDSAATEKAFDDLIEAARDAFRADDTLGGVVATCIIDSVAGAQVQDSGPVMFGNVLCHGARLALATRHFQ